MSTFFDANYAYGSGATATIRLTLDAAAATSASTIATSAVVTLITNASLTDSSGNATAISNGLTASSGNVAISFGSGGGSVVRLITDGFKAVSYGATTAFVVTGTITGVDATGTMTVTGTIYLPARIYVAPTAPSAVSTSRTSDTQLVTSWTNNSTGGSTTSAPYLSQNVQRKDNVNTSPVTVVTGLSGAATSFTDNTTIANRRYEYRVVAVNSTGSTTSAWAAATQTTPAGPSNAVATKSGSDIVTTFTEGQSAGMVVTLRCGTKLTVAPG